MDLALALSKIWLISMEVISKYKKRENGLRLHYVYQETLGDVLILGKNMYNFGNSVASEP